MLWFVCKFIIQVSHTSYILKTKLCLIVVIGGYPWEDNEPNSWAKSRRKIETIANKALSRFGQVPGKSPSAVGNQDSGLLKVLRTSAATKMVSSAILTGSLRSKHIDIQDMRPQDKCDNENVSVIDQQAFPSISVFSNLVEALEIAWVISSGNSHLLKEKEHGELKLYIYNSNRLYSLFL